MGLQDGAPSVELPVSFLLLLWPSHRLRGQQRTLRKRPFVVVVGTSCPILGFPFYRRQ